MTLSSILPLRWIYADPPHYCSASIAINLLNSVFNEAFSEPKTDAFPAIVESNGEAGDSAVNRSQGNSAFFGPNKIHAT